uniref:Uncharacterized protein n=1 Tax=Fibrocapsa japonica TaxID=94617 RepID=A0A7S2V2I3_9STRA|mmetsp:Transcript_22790/g.33069  ORF Transcript_22790/g.33069 Transcript_22790/m.33069 type:complete len:274 (+) Transcript_22790:145-966(+)|eukprot:CAMPEP_0113944310 /NCGR_PEP_ID=MMETSP1339-20121228/33176_1 /TAXON_ID=94617 /ORGANISM="Fibrocapsa japonica" /LENGTH=273 /DNA_ID=CAMNT_0000949475 /DNA_START=88 /DNA_END=909 /DNA_ORIENTATION=+ /assembly_acc=CAM_ASM_000762
MALKSFGSQTLNDNWYEERAAPLRGVLADYGHRSLETTSRSAHSKPDQNMQRRGKSRAESMRQAHAARGNQSTALVQRGTVLEALRDRPTSRPDTGCWAVVPTDNGQSEQRYLEATNAASFGKPGRPSSTAQRMLRQPDAPIAGATSSRAAMFGEAVPKRSVKHTGVIGEVFKREMEPQQNTAAQRSWLPYNDPIIDIQKDRDHEDMMNRSMAMSQSKNRSMAMSQSKTLGSPGASTGSVDSPSKTSYSRVLTKTAENYGASLRPGVNIYMDA